MAVLVGLVVSVAVAVIGLGILTSKRRTATPPVISAVAPATTTPIVAPADVAVPASAAPARTDFRVQSAFAPLGFDLESNGGQGFAIATFVWASPSNLEYIATFDGDGNELGRSSPVSVADIQLHAVIRNKLITVSRTGQLTAFGMPGLGQHWTTALGDRAYAICEAKSANQLLLVLNDDRRLTVDLATGGQSPTREYCQVVAAIQESQLNPRDRHDYAAPRGVESYRCGSVRVMGSENYRVPDACLTQAQVNTDRLEGISGHRLWKLEKDWLVIGVRKPGIAIPMVGLLRHGKLAWNSVVPADDPLAAEEGSPYRLTLTADSIVLAYGTRKESRQFVTAFGLGDGARYWTTPLDVTPKRLTSSHKPGRVFVQSDYGVTILDSSNGNIVKRIGESR